MRNSVMNYNVLGRNIGSMPVNSTSDYIIAIVLFILLMIALLGISYLIIAGAWWIICWCFDLSIWSWKTTLGVWIACLLINQFNHMGDK